MIIVSCQKENNKDGPKAIVNVKHSTNTPSNSQSKVKIHPWDFNGEGRFESFAISNVKGKGNPAEDGIPDTYIVKFENKAIPDLQIGCCKSLPIGEGDLNGDGKAELSFFQEPMNGCVNTMSTYTLFNGKWKLLFEPFLVPTDCEEVSAETLEKIVFIEVEKVYILETDMNDENHKMTKKEVKLL